MAAAVLLALVGGLLVLYRVGLPPQNRQYSVGVATIDAIVDTPRSQVVDLAGTQGTDIASLAARASLLASLVAVSPIREEVATRAGIPPQRLIGLPPVRPGPESRRPRPVSGATIAIDDPEANILRPSVPFLAAGDNPIIEIEAQAPDAAAAARLATAALVALQAYLERVATADGVPANRRLVLQQFAPAAASTQRRGPSSFVAVLIGLGVLGVGCAGIVIATTLRTSLRAASDLRRTAAADPSAGQVRVVDQC